MSAARIVFLMYHELELAGRKLCQSEPGYVRYILPLETFREQMSWLKESGWRGLNVSEALRYPPEPSVCITFDDGCETDLIAAAPVLREFGLNATFYLTAGFVGTPGYLNAGQVRDLDSQGFQIGCHSIFPISGSRISSAKRWTPSCESRRWLGIPSNTFPVLAGGTTHLHSRWRAKPVL
jgi:hypothetical protein